MEKENIIYKGLLFSLQKEGNPAICNNMNEPRGWTKPDTERQMLYYLTYM